MQKLARTTGKTVVLTRPQTTLEGAAELLLKHKIGGLPVGGRRGATGGDHHHQRYPAGLSRRDGALSEIANHRHIRVNTERNWGKELKRVEEFLYNTPSSS